MKHQALIHKLKYIISIIQIINTLAVIGSQTVVCQPPWGSRNLPRCSSKNIRNGVLWAHYCVFHCFRIVIKIIIIVILN